MRTFFVLEYKLLDAKGREKTPKHVGVFKTLDSVDEKKNELLNTLQEKITFQVYAHESIF